MAFGELSPEVKARLRANIQAVVREVASWARRVVAALRRAVKAITARLQAMVDGLQRYAARSAKAWAADWDRANRFFASHPDLDDLDRWLDGWYGGEPRWVT